ncbi:hypothetical protein B0O80DRAFT_444612 [Mortierella sp. GBAus27b]|nr:hypothetical protein B0O80DRAFT_444612 [Mortierella sp. GBAus27b]
MGSSSLSVIAMQTFQRVSWLASTSLNWLVFSALISFLSSPTVLADEAETGKALSVASPSTRQNRVSCLSVKVL